MSYSHSALGVHDLVVGKSYIPLNNSGNLDYVQAGTFVKKSANPNTATLKWNNKPFVFKAPARFVQADISNGSFKPITVGGKRSRKALRKKRRSITCCAKVKYPPRGGI